jgi:hypothetical protein
MAVSCLNICLSENALSAGLWGLGQSAAMGAGIVLSESGPECLHIPLKGQGTVSQRHCPQVSEAKKRNHILISELHSGIQQISIDIHAFSAAGSEVCAFVWAMESRENAAQMLHSPLLGDSAVMSENWAVSGENKGISGGKWNVDAKFSAIQELYSCLPEYRRAVISALWQISDLISGFSGITWDKDGKEHAVRSMPAVLGQSAVSAVNWTVSQPETAYQVISSPVHGIAGDVPSGIAWDVSESTAGSAVSAVRWGLASGESAVYQPEISGDPESPVISYPVAEDGSAVFVKAGWAILLDGKDISEYILSARTSHETDALHNEIEFTVAGLDVDPAEQEGTARVELRDIFTDEDTGEEIILRKQYFLMERKSGDGIRITLWGRDVTATNSNPYSEEITVSESWPVSAKELAGSYLDCDLIWEVTDWPVRNVSFTGSPMEMVKYLAEAVGAKVRPTADGKVRVRRRFSVRPVYLQDESPEIRFDKTLISGMNYEDVRGEGFGSVYVSGYASGFDAPELELEDMPEGQTRYQGTPSYIRIYWSEAQASASIPVVDTFVTSGILTDLGERTTIEETERVVFTEGMGTVSKPITQIVRIEWIGIGGYGYEFAPYKKEIRLTDGFWAVADVTYRATYQRFLTTRHDVPLQLAAFGFGLSATDISLTAETDKGGTEAPAISDPLLTTYEAAIERATAFIDDNRYNCRKATVSVPFDVRAWDGEICFLDNDMIGEMGNYYIDAVNTEYDGPAVRQSLTVKKCQV